jgi:hypothetical protein
MDYFELMSASKEEASWAVWSTDAEGKLTGEAQFPEAQARDAAHGRSMIVSLNPSGIRAADGSERAGPWSNFHSPNKVHNDDFLASALIDTELWGSFMTDLHPTIWESDSRKLGRIPASAIDEAVGTLIAQARLLGEVELVVAVGSATHRHLQKRLAVIREKVGNPNLRLVRIPHYSKANARVHKQRRETYRLLVEEALADNS